MSDRKLMIVEGYTVPAEIEDSTLAWIREASGFAAGDVIRGLHLAGVPKGSVDAKYGPWGPAVRIADRLLQRERRAGRIAFRKGSWWPA